MRARLVWILSTAMVACSGSTMTGYNNSTGGNPQGTGSSVSIIDYSFSPETLSVTAGTQVTWMNNGGTDHTATADDNSWNSGTLAAPMGGGGYGGGTAGQSFSHTFSSQGTFAYHCGFHASMHGVIKVN
jgi:plastocyanin